MAADIALAGLPYEEQMIGRASRFAFDSQCSLLTCSAEDLIVAKAFAGRNKDWLDIEGVIACQGKRLDQAYILTALKPLAEAKGEPGLADKLRRLLQSGGA